LARSADDVGGYESADGKAAVRQVGNLHCGGSGLVDASPPPLPMCVLHGPSKSPS